MRRKYWINKTQNLVIEIMLTYVFIEKSCFFNILFAAPRARELELEDHQSRLEQKLREKMAIDGKSKGTACPSLQNRLCQPCFLQKEPGWLRLLCSL